MVRRLKIVKRQAKLGASGFNAKKVFTSFRYRLTACYKSALTFTSTEFLPDVGTILFQVRETHFFLTLFFLGTSGSVLATCGVIFSYQITFQTSLDPWNAKL